MTAKMLGILFVAAATVALTCAERCNNHNQCRDYCEYEGCAGYDCHEVRINNRLSRGNNFFDNNRGGRSGGGLFSSFTNGFGFGNFGNGGGLFGRNFQPGNNRNGRGDCHCDYCYGRRGRDRGRGDRGRDRWDSHDDDWRRGGRRDRWDSRGDDWRRGGRDRWDDHDHSDHHDGRRGRFDRFVAKK